jgi:hypothetical protein
MYMKLRLGQILVDSGVLTEQQVEQVLTHQEQSGRPFGVLCEELFGIEPKIIENAWAHQYAFTTRTIDPRYEVFDEQVRDLITRRQAWQFRVLPIRFDNRELMVATTAHHLPRALRFIQNSLGVPTYFVLADAQALGEALCRYYPLPGMTPMSVCDSAMDALIGEYLGRERESA